MSIGYDNIPTLVKINDLTLDEAGSRCGISGGLLSRLARGKVSEIKNPKKKKAVGNFLLNLHRDAIKTTKNRLKELEAMRN